MLKATHLLGSIHDMLSFYRLQFVMFVLLTGCQQDDPRQKDLQAYLEHIDQLETLLNIDAKSSTQSTLPKQNLEDIRFPSRRHVRFQLDKAPALNFRDFMRLSNCSISNLIAYRNSPLGRAMLSSQQIAYEHRFLQSAIQCLPQLKTPLKERLTQVIQHKEKNWDQLRWNALWSSRELALFFSISSPHKQRPKKLDAQDEALLLWLTQIKYKQQMNLSKEYERRLENLPAYVGGFILKEANSLIEMLRVSTLKLQNLSQSLSQSLHSETSPLKPGQKTVSCLQSQKALQQVANLQARISDSYQQLERLQGALNPSLSSQDLASLPLQTQSYLKRWFIKDSTRSASKEFKVLLSQQVKFWSEIQTHLDCD